MVACPNGNVIMASALLIARADPNVPSECIPPRTAMDFAACARNTEIISLLRLFGGRGLNTRESHRGQSVRR